MLPGKMQNLFFGNITVHHTCVFTTGLKQLRLKVDKTTMVGLCVLITRRQQRNAVEMLSRRNETQRPLSLLPPSTINSLSILGPGCHKFHLFSPYTSHHRNGHYVNLLRPMETDVEAHSLAQTGRGGGEVASSGSLQVRFPTNREVGVIELKTLKNTEEIVDVTNKVTGVYNLTPTR
jgi:hypothetical protein